jgi:hypothetical protein
MNTDRRIYESELEDFLEKCPGALREDGCTAFIGRQVDLPHGRLDLLLSDDQLLIVELKARPLQEKDVCQVLRYQYDIRAILRQSGRYLREHPEAFPGRSNYGGGLAIREYDAFIAKRFMMTGDTADEPITCPVLIGSAASEEIVAAMDAIGGRVYVWKAYEYEKIFSFWRRFPEIESITEAGLNASNQWIERYIGWSSDLGMIEADHEQDLLVWRLFGDSVLYHPSEE